MERDSLIYQIELERLNASIAADQIIDELINTQFPEKTPEITDFIRDVYSPKISIIHGLNPMIGNYEIKAITNFRDPEKQERAKKENPDLYREIIPVCQAFLKEKGRI